MAYTIPNNDVAFNANQSRWYEADIAVLVAAFNGTYVQSGCEVTAQGTPDMTVAVASGTVVIAGAITSVSSGNVTITTANGTNPRIDLIVVASDGTKSAVAGTAAASPKAPDHPSDKVVLAMVYVPANDTTIASNQIIDKRVLTSMIAPLVRLDSNTVSQQNAGNAQVLRVLESLTDSTHWSGLTIGETDSGAFKVRVTRGSGGAGPTTSINLQLESEFGYVLLIQQDKRINFGGGFFSDQDNGAITLGRSGQRFADVIAIQHSTEGANGQRAVIQQATTTVSCSGATSSASNLIPAGSMVLGVDTRVTTAITGATSFDIGDGTTANLFGDDESVSLNATTTLSDHLASFTPKLYTAATSVVLTANGSNFTGGVVRVTVHYYSLTAATS